jgi:thioredoxin reductase (NADPH)
MARAGLEPLMLAGLNFGGQLMITTDVENYPGYPEGVTGPLMMEEFQKQAERFGTEILFEDATSVDFSSKPLHVATAGKQYTADAVVIATGASARWLGIESEERLVNKGVSACATCDGALFRNKPMAVVGGGDTAMEEALFLTRFATKVTLIHRRGELRASKIMQERALANDKIDFAWHSAVEEVLGDEFVTGVRLKDVRDGSTRDLDLEALFIAIGHQPNTSLFKNQLDLDDSEYLKVAPGTTRTSIEGVFACGDVADPVYRQAVTAAGTGCMSAIDAERWLAEQGIG